MINRMIKIFTKIPKIILIFLFFLFTSISLASDEKPGRFFEDQPDVNDDYQIHFIYLLAKKTKDKEPKKTIINVFDIQLSQQNAMNA